MQTQKQYDFIETMRFFAILSVALAHLSQTAFPSGRGAMALVPRCYAALGTVGVSVFFLISGFLYRRAPGDTATFWAKKAKYVILPTVIAGAVNYTVGNFLSFSLPQLLVYCYGGGTWLYYITVLCLLFAVFHFLWQSDAALLVCMAVNVLSVFLFASEVIPQGALPYPYFTPYLLVTNWIGFFALGVFLRRHADIERAAALLSRYWVFPLLFFLPTTLLYSELAPDISYFTFPAIPYELLGVLTVFVLSVRLKSNRCLLFIGQSSFFIYLYHITPLGWMSTRLGRSPVVAAVPFFAVFGVALVYFLLERALIALKVEKILPLLGGKKKLTDERKK